VSEGRKKLGSWKAGKLEGWEAGKLGSWKAGRLESWKAGRLGSWNAGKLEGWEAGTPVAAKICMQCMLCRLPASKHPGLPASVPETTNL